MSASQKISEPTYRRLTQLIIVAGIVILAISLWFWWAKVYTDPEQTFWGAVSNNLAITGVSKHITAVNSGGTLDQYQQLNLGANNVARSLVHIEQGSNGTKVDSETVGTPDSEFSRYVKIETKKAPGKKALNFTPVINQWSKQSVEAGKSSLAEAVYDAIPFALLTTQQRQEVVSTMQREKVYTIDFGSIERRTTNGRQVFEYAASISPEKYVKVLKMVDHDMGLNQLANVDESQYANSQPFRVKISVDIRARQLTNITYIGSSNRAEEITAYGAHGDTQLPDNPINQEELQRRLNKILSGLA